MNDLAGAHALVRERIAKHQGQSIGEENTKHALIEPVLRALGWDVEDLDEVRCEFKLKAADNPVDYALFVHGNLRRFVEAKALGENFDKSANQVMGYAGVAGIVEWIVLTDGNGYRIYNAHAAVPVDQKLFKRVVLASDQPDGLSTLELLSKAQLQGTVIDDLWRQHFVDRQVRAAVEGMSGIEPATDFLHLVRKRVPALSAADVRQRLGRASLSLVYPGAQSVVATTSASKAPADPTSSAVVVPIPPSAGSNKTPWSRVTLKDLISSGAVALPLDVEATCQGQRLAARIETDGRVTWDSRPLRRTSRAPSPRGLGDHREGLLLRAPRRSPS